MSLILFLYGLVIGSFLNVLIDRLPKSQPITGRSHCDHCKKQLRSIDLIPVVSFLALGRKSHCCKKPLSWFYPFVELLTGISFVIIGGDILMFGIISALIVIFFADYKYHIIPDEATIALFIFSTFTLLSVGNKFDHLLGGLVLLLGMYGLYWITKGKGLGFGDVKLAFVIGWLLGLKSGFLAIYLAFILGGIVSAIFLLIKQRKMKSKIAFGPFLVIGITIMLFFEREVFGVVNRIFDF